MKSKKGIPCSNMREFDAIMDGTASDSKPQPTPTPWDFVENADGTFTLESAKNMESLGIIRKEEDAIFIDHAVNCHEELLQAAKNAGNVLAALINGDLSIRHALALLRKAIAKAEGK